MREVVQRRQLADHLVGRRTFSGARHPDHRAELGTKSGQDQNVVESDADTETDQQRRNFRGDDARFPHHRKSDERHGKAERLHIRQIMGDGGERDVAVEAADISKLHQEQQRSRRILHARHDRMRRIADQRAEPDQTEQSLKRAAEQDNREEGQNDDVHIAAARRMAASECTS